MFKLAVLFTLVAALGATATPTPVQREVAPRSFQSGGNTCYYTCPPTNNNGVPVDNNQAIVTGNSGQPLLLCTYDQNVTPGQGGCFYDANGVYSNNNGAGNSNCPGMAPVGTCQPTGSTPPGNQIKRALGGKRALTAAQQLVAARQYKPRKLSAEVADQE